MSIPEDEPTLKELMTRLTELERANAHMSEELSALRAGRTTGGGQEQVNKQATTVETFGKTMMSRKRRSRRGLLRKGLGVAAATFGTAALLEMSGSTALANGTESSTTFNNNGGSSPAVTANSTSPASSKVNAIYAKSTGYTGIAGYTNQNSNGASGVYGQGPFVGVSGQINGANTSPSTPVGVYGTGSKGSNLGGVGVQGQGDTNNGVLGTSSGYTGVAGKTSSSSFTASGVYGQGPSVGVAGQVNGAITQPNVKVGVYGTGSNGSSLGGIGVQGESDINHGVYGVSFSTTTGYGVYGQNSNGYGVVGSGARGVFGTSASSTGVLGMSSTNVGVWGQSLTSSGTGVVGSAPGASTVPSGSIGVYGTSSNGSNNGGVGTWGEGDTGYGVIGNCPGYDGWGVAGSGDTSIGVGVYASGATAIYASGNPTAGQFSGNVNVSGTLSKGGGSFKIDHPLDPANKYLSHSFVESPDMKNVYDGVVTLDANGEATVTLPSWFEALNTDFRYQLTPIGTASPNLHIAAEISNLNFKIAGGTAGIKVCWQVTGIRQDAWAKAYRIPIEQDKAASERGHYLYPKLYGHPSDPSIVELPYVEKISQLKKLHR